MSHGDTNTKPKGQSQANPPQSEALNASQLSLDDPLSAPSHPSAPLGFFTRRLDRWHNKGVVTGLRGSLQALHDGVAMIPSLQSAIEILISCVDLLPTTTSREEFKQITAELQMLSNSLTRHLTNSAAEPSKCMTNLSLLIQQQATLIATKRGLNLNKGRRFEESKRYEEEIRGHYQQINSLFRQLMVNPFIP
ncbi:unnamed protein product [Rhizoctonia solani]|uniref:Uncharacterized protein n=1 Tax=Rhizoctonia solani TaxID=456999 RepID=A0A8H3GPV4_9AGAM|nr:unnamed protein product [Rhizoctonia solani]